MTLRSVYEDIELPLVPVLAGLELAGVGVDVPYLAELRTEIEQAAREDYDQVREVVGYDINTRSYPQKARFFYDECKEPVKRRTDTGQPAVDKYALGLAETERGGRAARALLRHTESLDALSDFVCKLPGLVRGGRIHGSFNQAGTWEDHGDYRASPATGRLSSSGPNLQQISTHGRWGPSIRRAFRPKPGYVYVAGDMAAEELRVASYLASESAFLDAFARDDDVHSLTASRVGLGTERQLGKMLNYALIYGVMPAKLLAMVPALGNLTAARAARTHFFEAYPAFPKWWQAVWTEAHRNLYAETMFGRRRYLLDIRAGGAAFAKELPVEISVGPTWADLIKEVR
jgi:DNA polymerase-1